MPDDVAPPCSALRNGLEGRSENLHGRQGLPRESVRQAGNAPIEQIKRDAVRALTQQLGPMAETVALKIERSKTLAELRPLLTLGAQMLRDHKGVQAADAFALHFLSVDVPT